MALIVCRRCRRAFINTSRGEEVCPGCIDKLHRLYPVVRDFLRDNANVGYALYDIARLLEIDLIDLQGLVSLGLIATDAGEAVREESRETQRQPPKIRALDSKEEKEVEKSIDREKSSMHVYHKKQIKAFKREV